MHYKYSFILVVLIKGGCTASITYEPEKYSKFIAKLINLWNYEIEGGAYAVL